jgi:hypothetical protein
MMRRTSEVSRKQARKKAARINNHMNKNMNAFSTGKPTLLTYAARPGSSRVVLRVTTGTVCRGRGTVETKPEESSA